MTLRVPLLALALLVMLTCAAVAQDRPLLEPFRIGYIGGERIAERLRASPSFAQAMRRKGFLTSWRVLDSGLAAVRALHAEEVDLALDVSLPDVVAAKREQLAMVFIAELRSIAPSCCDLEERFAEHTFKRYTLSSEYFADKREDVLLLLHEELIKAMQQNPEPIARAHRNLGPIPVARTDGQAVRIETVTRRSMLQTQALLPAESGIDIADVNYWMPSTANQ